MQKTVIRWIPSIVICAFIFWLSSQTGPELKQAGLGSNEIHIAGHFWMFFFLSIAFYKATKNIPVSILMSLFYALTDEYHQSFTYGRSSSWSDVFNDTLAASVAGLILWKFYAKLPLKLRNWLSS